MCVCVCVCVCESAPGVPKVSYFTVSGAPGVRQKGKNLNCCGSPPPKKIDFRSRYVCVFIRVLIANTTIGKSRCVFMCNPCVCFVQSVCVFVCNPCVCLWPIFHRKLRGFKAQRNPRFWETPHVCGNRFAQFLTVETANAEIRVCVGRFAQ